MSELRVRTCPFMDTGFAFSVPSRYDGRVDAAGEHRESHTEESLKVFWVPEVILCH
jgi:hypothetical protein